MKYAYKELASSWIDDHLDLYNFAVSIGDTDWQQHILQTLKEKDQHIQHEQEQRIRIDLWLTFDRINREIIELYEQLRKGTDSEDEKLRIMEKMWAFKQQRVKIVSRLKEMS